MDPDPEKMGLAWALPCSLFIKTVHLQCHFTQNLTQKGEKVSFFQTAERLERWIGDHGPQLALPRSCVNVNLMGLIETVICFTAVGAVIILAPA